MPIRHCQHCGIKVIVDEDKASVFPFYCDLCASKSGSGEAPAVEAGPPGPPPGKPPPPVQKPRPGSSSPTCPRCGVALPVTPGQRPVKLRCSQCGSELAVFSSGQAQLIQPGEILQFARTQEVSVGEGTQGLKARIREIMRRRALEEGGSTDPSKGPGSRTPPARPRSPSAQTPSPPRIVVRRSSSEGGVPPRAGVETTQPNPQPPSPTEELKQAVGSSVPSPPEDEEAVPTELRRGFIGDEDPSEGGRPPPATSPAQERGPAPGGEEPPESAEPAGRTALPAGPKVRRVPVPVALAFVLLPLAAAAAFPALPVARLDPFAKKIGTVMAKGAVDISNYVSEQLKKTQQPVVQPPPRKPVKEKRPEFSAQDMEEEMTRDFENLFRVVRRYAKEQDESKWAGLRERIGEYRRSIDRWRDLYEGHFKKHPDLSSRIGKPLEELLTELYGSLRQKNYHLRKGVPPEVETSMRRQIQDLEDIKSWLSRYYAAFFGKPFRVKDSLGSPEKPTREEMRRKVQEAYEKWQAKYREVQAEGENASQLKKTLAEVFRNDYLKLKEKYEKEFGEKFEPEK